MTEEGFLSRAEIIHLAEKLSHVSDLEREMAIALTGQTRPRGGGYTRHQKPGSKPPYPLHIADLLDELGNELTTTARDICEHRGLEYDGGSSIAGVAKWISHHRHALAFMAHAAELFEGMCSIIDRCQRAMNHIEAEHVIDHARVEAANRQVVTREAMEKLAPKLGEAAKGLTARRVKYMENRGVLDRAGTDPDSGVAFYRLGDVLHAHAVLSASRGTLRVSDR